MQLSRRHIRYFLFSQYLADGIRTTLEIVIPVIICAQLGYIEYGYTIALGALCVSVSDAPGPVEHKRNGMLACTAFVFVMALLTGLVNSSPLLLGVLVAVAAFIFTMFSIYGNRAGSIGTAALLIMVLRMSNETTPPQLLLDSLLILGGGVWYLVIALLFFRVTPYRPGQRALGECIHETANFLRLKGDFYNAGTDLSEAYRKLVAQQVLVNEKQDGVRELLFKNRELVEESTRKGKLLILTFADLMEAYEQITATWYDYESLHEKFGSTGILAEVGQMISHIADELDDIGLAIQSNYAAKKKFDFGSELERLKTKTDALGENDPGNLVLKKILVNLRNIARRVDDLYNYFSADKYTKRSLKSGNYYANFVSHQQIDWSVFKNNLNLQSSVFRHSLRMMITCIAGFTIAKMIDYGHHSYWILLTIIIILKPGFGLSKERNIQRIIGTVAGGLLGVGLLAFINNRDVLFALLVLFMLGTYTYQRFNYIVMVIFTTPYVLILFHLFGLPFWDIARERLLDTGIGCLLGFMASYLLLPQWEGTQLTSYMAKVLKANIDYLQKLRELMSGKTTLPLEYKLVRKELYVSIANLSAAFHRMLSEPAHKQKNRQQADRFVVMNHIFWSNAVSLSTSIREGGLQRYPREIMGKLKKTIINMEESLLLLNKTYQPIKDEPLPTDIEADTKASYLQLANQLDFINKIAIDVKKVTAELKGE